MAQVPGLGLDQSQLADVINQQYKGYSQKQRNQMMQSAAATPDNWGAVTEQANKTATQPTEFLGAGRLNNIPSVSKDGQQMFRVSDTDQESLTPWMASGGATPYQNDSSTYGQYNDAKNTQAWVNQYINTKRQATDPQITSLDQFYKEYGQTPEGGWSDRNTKGAGLSALLRRNGNQANPLQSWMSDPNAAMNFSLYGSGSTDDLQRGFNILQRSAPQNIGEFWSMSPEVQKGILQNPGISLQQMKATANPANRDWLSVGAEGGLRDISNWEWNNQRGLTTTPGSYMQIHDENNGLDMVRKIGEPVGNLAGAIFSGGIPWGSIVAGAANLSTGNDQAILGNIVNGLVSYGGSQISLGGTGGAPVETAVGSSGAAANSMAGSSGGVFGSGVSLGSTAANQAAQGMLMNAGSNYARTGDLENALKAVAFSTASGAAGNWLGNATQGQLGEIGSKALGGAASGGLNSLFSGNSPVNGSLFGAMSGGLHGFLNSTDRSNKTYNQKQNIDNKNIAQTATNLAKLFVKK